MAVENPRILICTVGTGRDRQDIAQAIVFSIGQHQASGAVFLCSPKTQEETLPLVLAQLGWPAERYRTHVSADVDDVQRLFVEWNRAWGDWLTSWPKARVAVDFTSGTKPMSAAAFALAVARGADAVSYVVGERDTTGRATCSTAVRAFAPALVVAHRQLQMAVEHFHAGDYGAARDLAQKFLKIEALPDDHLREVARSIHFVAAAYEAWGRFDWKQAARYLKESQRFWPEWPWVDSAARLAANRQLIDAAKESCQQRDYGPAIVADLLGNVDRCLIRQAWDDAVARLYRACELLAQMRLHCAYGQDTGNIDPSRLPEPLRGRYQERKDHVEGGKLKLGLEQAYTLLEELGDELGGAFFERAGSFEQRRELRGLLSIRNDSLLAHGLQPIGEEKARKLREHVFALARVADPAIMDEWLPKAEPVRFGSF